MKVEINGKTYCVETLIADNERLRKDVIASADTNRLVLDSVRAEIETYQSDAFYSDDVMMNKRTVLEIIDKYRK